ncbi:MAG: hypothetical protein JXA71_12355 [Chitinispirillaceae bacterium]|nr:hypothetical protein [Chitinispirillaceae bacterium]
MASVSAEPIVVHGAMLPALLGIPVHDIRVIDERGKAVPFQLDEMTPEGEYVCPQCEKANAEAANGIFDAQDEIVFLWEDAGSDSAAAESLRGMKDTAVLVTVRKGAARRYVWISGNSGLPASATRYLDYDHASQYLKTPFYYAQFGYNRFHFITAGVMDFVTGKYQRVTNELRVSIVFRTLWGLLPFTYSEENIVCTVSRYKAGPLRLIRRGDFHLRLGLGIKGSRAVVYQFCYPQMVKVPVRVHLPLRFRSLFSDAFIEMTPVLHKEAGKFRFMVPSLGFLEPVSARSVDTLIQVVPDKGYLVSDGTKGYGWITRINADPSLLSGSGYVLRRPTKRQGIAECGFKLTVRDLPRGNYDILNWVFFSKDRQENQQHDLLPVLEPAMVTVNGKDVSNLLVAPAPSSAGNR